MTVPIPLRTVFTARRISASLQFPGAMVQLECVIASRDFGEMQLHRGKTTKIFRLFDCVDDDANHTSGFSQCRDYAIQEPAKLYVSEPCKKAPIGLPGRERFRESFRIRLSAKILRPHLVSLRSSGLKLDHIPVDRPATSFSGNQCLRRFYDKRLGNNRASTLRQMCKCAAHFDAAESGAA
jgi:hypothetical protein